MNSAGGLGTGKKGNAKKKKQKTVVGKKGGGAPKKKSSGGGTNTKQGLFLESSHPTKMLLSYI
jgi:hypothetical protein